MYCFCFVLLCIWGQFPSTSPLETYIWRGDLAEGFLRCRFGGLIFVGAYTWRGLFSEFYGTYPLDSDLSNGQRYPSFQQGPELKIPTLGVNFHWEPSPAPPCTHYYCCIYIHPLGHFKNVFSASSAASLSLFPFIQRPIFCFHREVWGIKVCQIFHR